MNPKQKAIYKIYSEINKDLVSKSNYLNSVINSKLGFFPNTDIEIIKSLKENLDSNLKSLKILLKEYNGELRQ